MSLACLKHTEAFVRKLQRYVSQRHIAKYDLPQKPTHTPYDSTRQEITIFTTIVSH